MTYSASFLRAAILECEMLSFDELARFRATRDTAARRLAFALEQRAAEYRLILRRMMGAPL